MNTLLKLTLWQKKQATLLYHFASLEYLKGLQWRVNDLIAFIDPTLDLAKTQNRDSVLTDARWGIRDTSANWANNAWPFLTDFQLDIAKDIANRAFEIYNITGSYGCGRGMNEFSMQWATPAEEDKFKSMFQSISEYADYVNDTMNKSQNNWIDFAFTLAWDKFKDQFPRLPKFRIRTDVEGETGKVPARTGVYIPQDDPHGSLQFAWVGGGRGKLIYSNTFNDIGLDALKFIGRQDMWRNEQKMFAFATSPKYAAMFKKGVFIDSLPASDLAAGEISQEAFTNRPCKWYFVELINDEFEDIAQDDDAVPAPPARLRVEGGQPCPEAGYYFTPARTRSRRRFAQGETMPDFDANYGKTIWQWDTEQDGS